MKKAELIAIMAETSGLTKTDTEKALSAFMDAIKENVKNAPIPLVGFGKFEMKHRAARKQRNPQNGQMIDVPASNRVSFSAGKELKEAVNK